ncbi:hypothetical protein QCA50_010986 [Cerrena zonata]|uniref:Uncharacterized protein n=1 Tax=Cerrena zonata TaxID=2478898 RepID=A0AAW0FZU7_9APHY
MCIPPLAPRRRSTYSLIYAEHGYIPSAGILRDIYLSNPSSNDRYPFTLRCLAKAANLTDVWCQRHKQDVHLDSPYPWATFLVLEAPYTNYHRLSTDWSGSTRTLSASKIPTITSTRSTPPSNVDLPAYESPLSIKEAEERLAYRK